MWNKRYGAKLSFHKKFIALILLVVLVINPIFMSPQALAGGEGQNPSASGIVIPDISHNNLGFTPLSPGIKFNDEEFINTQNGNLSLTYTDITLPGRGIPLRIYRGYNSHLAFSYSGAVRVTDSSSKKRWKPENPVTFNRGGLKALYSYYTIMPKDAGYFIDTYLGADPSGAINLASCLTGVSLELWPYAVGVMALFYGVNVVEGLLDLLSTWLNGDTSFWGTTFLLTIPNGQWGVNEVFAITDNQGLDTEEIADKERSHPLKQLTLILNDGETYTFHAKGTYITPTLKDEETWPPAANETVEYLADNDKTNFRITYNPASKKYIVQNPSGISYYLDSFTEIIEGGGYLVTTTDPETKTEDQESVQEWVTEKIYVAYALPNNIKDQFGNTITIQRDPATQTIIGVTDTLGHTISIERPSPDQESLNLPGGRTYTYMLSNGNITQIVDPEGNISEYRYVLDPNPNAEMTYSQPFYCLAEMTIPAGGRISYQGGKVIKARLAYSGNNVEPYTTTFTYETDPSSEKASTSIPRCIVTDPEGNKTLSVFEAITDTVKVREDNPATGFTDETLYADLVRIVHSMKVDGYGDYNLISRYAWTPSMLLKEVKVEQEGEGFSTTYEYDQFRNVTKSTDPFGHVVIQDYKYITDNDKYIVNRLAHKLEYNGSQAIESWNEYDDKGNLIQGWARFNGEKTLLYQMEYDSYGNLKRKTKTNGLVTEIDYDETNTFPIKTSQIAGDKILSQGSQYDVASGNLLVQEDLNGLKTIFSYDKVNRLVKKTFPDGTVEEHNYQVKNNLAQNFPDNKHIVLIHDAITDQTRERYELANGLGWVEEKGVRKSETEFLKTRNSYDGNGKVTEEIDPAGKITKYYYDSLGRVFLNALPDSSFILSEYNYYNFTMPALPSASIPETSFFAMEQLVSDANWHQTKNIYDSLGRLRWAQDAANGITCYYYDELGNVSYIKDPKGFVTSYEYNELGKPVKNVTSNGSTTTVNYNVEGEPILYRNAKGQEIRYEYDPFYRLVLIDYPDPFQDVHYRYDESEVTFGKGHVTSIEDQTGWRRLYYDARGMVIKDERSYAALDNTSPLITSYTYDGEGRPLSTDYPVGGLKVHYYYDLAGRIKEMTLDNSSEKSVLQLGYDDTGTVSSKSYGNGVLTEYKYDERGRMVKLSSSKQEEALLKLTYEYDRMGNRTGMQETFGETTSYEYDSLDRLTKVNYESDAMTSYTYDSNGNRMQMQYHFGTVAYTYAQNSNQLLRQSRGDGSYEEFGYDENGSIINRQVFRGDKLAEEIGYSYDIEGRLSAVDITHEGQRVSHVAYTYDQRGMCITREDPEQSTVYVRGQQDQVLAEITPDGKVQKVYLYLGAERVALLQDNTVYYYNSDILGSPAVITNADGKIVQRFRYEPFGNMVSSEGIMPQEFLFTGKEVDPNTALYDFGARFYDSELGRFISADPAKDGLNWYTYCYNNPLKLIDPDGQDVIVVDDSSRAVGFGHLFIIVISPISGEGYVYSFGPKNDNTAFGAGKVTTGVIPSEVLKDKQATLDWLDNNRFIEYGDNGFNDVHFVLVPMSPEATRKSEDWLDTTSGLNDVRPYPYYNFTFFNCDDFVLTALKAGGEVPILEFNWPLNISVPDMDINVLEWTYGFDPWGNAILPEAPQLVIDAE